MVKPPLNRRWLQFKIRTMLCLTAVAALFFAWPHISRQYAFWRLHEYVGIDIKNLPDNEKQRVNKWIGDVLGMEEEPLFWIPPENWHLYKSNRFSSEGRIYVLQMEPTMSIPGASYCQIHILDRRGRVASSLRFNVGYRAWPDDAAFDESRYGILCLTVKTHHTWIGETRQYYRVTDDHVELLRSERTNGTMEMGGGNSFEVAGKPSDWSSWQRLVASDDIVNQLRGLAAFWSYDNQRSRTLVDEATQLRLELLSRSNDPWISEESAAALRVLAEQSHHKRTDVQRLNDGAQLLVSRIDPD